jgi:predicted amidohydrolase YtcJ
VRLIAGSGIIWGLGPDGGVVAPINPFSTLWWVVTGIIYPDQKVQEGVVTREQALVAHTRSNAYLLFKEKDLGSLESGKLADFVVLDRDYMTIPEDQIKEIKPVMTVVGGGRLSMRLIRNRGLRPCHP